MNDMIKIVLAFFVALGIAFASTPLAKLTAEKIGAIDVPRDARRMHKTPIPRLGGIAIYFGFVASFLFFGVLTPEMLGILAGSVIIVILGILDDRKPIKASVKFLVQLVAATVVALSGVKIEVFTNPLLFSSQEYLILGSLSIPVTVLWIAAVTNAVNLIDGLDGLAAGVASISSVCLLVIALMFSETNIAVFTACIAGACIGFLPYNLNPAKIFMGDSGALFLGFVLACISIEGVFKAYAVISFAVPLLVLALPIFDTTIAILRRIKNKKPIMQPDRGHLHHRLIDMGFNQKQAVLILYLIAGLLGLSAIVLTRFGMLMALGLLLIAVAVIIITVIIRKCKGK
ncbi:MAG: undecaprenyl/decaprenyl-phosphate alpha-N-acetylglucosaminyl 1-phosphate transferase [Clostridia bacterium]|nr:undecaprenyl/decaprenyl-phosphate alpha-N-acetylglucosaminyl 1-phosphate transferase [Clostridia bacterium]